MSNENFDWDQESQDSDLESGAESVIAEENRHVSIGTEAMRRIEQAKLYESLLSHPLFAPGSGSPDIINKVDSEIKAFIAERLETLLGMRSPTIQAAIPGINMPFTDAQVKALQALANRVLKTETPKDPVVVPYQKTTQDVAPTPAQVNQIRPNTPASRTGPAPAPKRPAKRRTENVSQKTNQDYSQAVGTKRKPVPPPSVEQQNIMAAMSAGTKRMVQSGDVVGDGDAQNILAIGTQVATRMNSNVREED